MKQRHRCWARRQAPPQAPPTKASRSLLLWTFAALSRCCLRTSPELPPMHLAFEVGTNLSCVSLLLPLTGLGAPWVAGLVPACHSCALSHLKPADFFNTQHLKSQEIICSSTDWLNRWTRRMDPWGRLAFNQDRSPMHLPEDPLTSPTRTPMGIKRDVGLCPQHRRWDRRALRHQDVSLPSHQTWAGYRPVKGKGWPCCLPSGHRIQFQFRTRMRVCCGDPGLQQANPSWKAPVWSHPTHQAYSYTPAEQIFSWAKGTPTGLGLLLLNY